MTMTFDTEICLWLQLTSSVFHLHLSFQFDLSHLWLRQCNQQLSRDSGKFSVQGFMMPDATFAGVNYTPASSASFYHDANITSALLLAPLFQDKQTPSTVSPGTNFYGFYGSGELWTRCHHVATSGTLAIWL